MADEVPVPPARRDLSAALDQGPLLLGRPSDAALDEQLLSPVWTRWSMVGKLAILGTMGGAGMLALLVAYVFWRGIGTLGNNIPAAWAFPITNFVWWIGIGHAGTFISAFLLLLEQRWRTSINRIAEAMTIFALIQAGLFPILHLGRPWFAYWLIPYPATLEIWPQFRAALPWDALAIFTYFSVSLVFWYMGLVPDFAALRDLAPGKLRRRIYGVLALGWRGSTEAWTHYRCGYGLIAAFAAPLMLSVESTVATDFATSLIPGWHMTMLPPYFVAAALLSGFAMVLVLIVPVRAIFRFENVITERHLDHIAKMLLLHSWIVSFFYMIEYFIAWYGQNEYEMYVHFVGWPLGPYAAIFWIMIACNSILPQLLWFRRCRTSPALLFILGVLVNVGVWSENFIIIVGSLSRGFLPSSWHDFAPTWVDILILLGTISTFFFLFLLFARFLPMIPASEVKELKTELEEEEIEEGELDAVTVELRETAR